MVKRHAHLQNLADAKRKKPSASVEGADAVDWCDSELPSDSHDGYHEHPGDLCLFLPKFHCEVNWIERFWGTAKAYARKHCLYTLPGLRETVWLPPVRALPGCLVLRLQL